MDKGTGRDYARMQPQWANGGFLPGPVPLPTVVVRQNFTPP